MYVTVLRCTSCGHAEPPGAGEYACARCGGIRDVEYDYEAIARVLDRGRLAADPRRDVSRYLPLLPLEPSWTVSPLAVGGTPIVPAPRLAKELGVAALAIKDDGRLPTASFKDRAP